MDWDSHRPIAPSTPTSISSQSTNSSRERLPPYKQLNPSPVVTTLSKYTDDELFRKGADELLRILRRVESDYKTLLSEHSNIIKDVNRRFQIFVLEARELKEINQKLQDDNQELRDLCCFLDDDRQRSRKLAREWQRFGRYTASVMHSEVAAYQEKLKQLEEKQSELLKDNIELKELCLFLDHERSQLSGDRDDGDGSSNGTMAGQEEPTQSTHADSDGQLTPTPQHSQATDSTASYVRYLEQKINHLEDEKKHISEKVERNGTDTYHQYDYDASAHRLRSTRADVNQPMHASKTRQGDNTQDHQTSNPSFSVNKPEAVVHAMKVLQVHEQLERLQDPVGDENLGDTEKAIVREMCNVVWRKLGDLGESSLHDSGASSQTLKGHFAVNSGIASNHSGTLSSHKDSMETQILPNSSPVLAPSSHTQETKNSHPNSLQNQTASLNYPGTTPSNKHVKGPTYLVDPAKGDNRVNQTQDKFSVRSFASGYTDQNSHLGQGNQAATLKRVTPSAHMAMNSQFTSQPSSVQTSVPSVAQSHHHTPVQNPMGNPALHSQHRKAPRSISSSAAYEGKHLHPQPRSYSSSSVAPVHSASLVTGSTYLYAQRNAAGQNTHLSQRPSSGEEHSSIPSHFRARPGQQESRKTYLDDRGL